MSTSETIMKGAEPFFFPGNDIGVLVCHGFTGTTQSMLAYGKHLASAGYTVIGPRLRGHGVSPQAMAKTTAGDWIASVDEALAELKKTCSQIYITGLSMGGTLSLYAAAKHGDAIKGVVSINGIVQVDIPDLAGLALETAVPEMIPGVGSDIKDPDSKELAYAELPVAAIRQIYVLAAVTRDLLPRIKCPALVIQSRDDHVVNPRNGPRIARLLGSSRIEMLWLDNSYHVATLDHDKGLIAERAAAFIKSIAGR